MREVVPEIARWRARGDIVATATIVGIGGSSPRELGALLAVNQRGEVAGSLSGGRRWCGVDAVCVVLTHEEKFETPLLLNALRSPAVSVGAMGSRSTHAQRMAQLRAAGVSEAEIARLASPVGLDLGGRTPEETVISVAAEIVALRHNRGGARLTGGSRALHLQEETPLVERGAR